PTRGMTPGRSNTTSATETSSTRCDTRSWLLTASNAFGPTDTWTGNECPLSNRQEPARLLARRQAARGRSGAEVDGGSRERAVRGSRGVKPFFELVDQAHQLLDPSDDPLLFS